MQLAIDVLNVKSDGIDTHAQLHGRGLIAMPLHQQLEQPQFVRRQIVICSLRLSPATWARPPATGGAQRFEEFHRGRVLEQIAQFVVKNDGSFRSLIAEAEVTKAPGTLRHD